MRLLMARLSGIRPFSDEAFPFQDETGAPRPVTVIVGGGGVGKTTLLTAIANTRPGHAVVSSVLTSRAEPDQPPLVACDWALGGDDEDRPHALRVTTPTTHGRGFDDDGAEVLRRREQALFDKRARERGFALLTIPAIRWFSRTPLSLHAPSRSVGRYDVRAPASFDDGSRADLTREVKQALAYADIAMALAGGGEDQGRGLSLLGGAMRRTVSAVLGDSGFEYLGLDAQSFEPMFSHGRGRARRFDELPTACRHLVAFAALTVRMLWAAYPGADPQASEGVVLIDEVDAGVDPVVAAGAL